MNIFSIEIFRVNFIHQRPDIIILIGMLRTSTVTLSRNHMLFSLTYYNKKMNIDYK